MTVEAFQRALGAFQKRTPFQPYTVELISGNRFQVDHPEALVRAGVAVHFATDGTPTLFDNEGVARLSGEVLSDSA